MINKIPIFEDRRNALERLVQFVGKAELDTRTGNNRFHLAVFVPGHLRDLWLRVLENMAMDNPLVGGPSFRTEPRE